MKTLHSPAMCIHCHDRKVVSRRVYQGLPIGVPNNLTAEKALDVDLAQSVGWKRILNAGIRCRAKAACDGEHSKVDE